MKRILLVVLGSLIFLPVLIFGGALLVFERVWDRVKEEGGLVNFLEGTGQIIVDGFTYKKK